MANLADGLGWLRLLTLFGIAATSLCLAFDGRYREFPVAAYAPAVGCFLALAWLGRGHTRNQARGHGGAREEAALAVVAVAAAATVLVGEGLGNTQALAWTGVVLAAAAIPALELWPRPAGLRPDGAERGEKHGGGTQLGVVEHERQGADGSGHRNGQPA
jgi:hypothetical protein